MKAFVVIKKGAAQTLGIDLDEARRRAVENRFACEFDSEIGYTVEISFEPEPEPIFPPL